VSVQDAGLRQESNMRPASNVIALLRDERGLETIEYAIVAGFIVVGIITAVTAIGVWLAGNWNTFKSALGA
jgi:Flp pilus assembly pilin Flp